MIEQEPKRILTQDDLDRLYHLAGQLGVVVEGGGSAERRGYLEDLLGRGVISLDDD